jgi:PhnB protein
MAKLKKAEKAKRQEAVRGGRKPAARSAKAPPAKPAAKSAAKRAPARAAPAARRSAAAKKVSPVAPGYHTVTPTLSVSECAKAIAFYKEAFGASESFRMSAPDGKSVWHAEIRIGDSPIMLSDPMDPTVKPPTKDAPSSIGVWLYVPDVDAVFAQATKAGATAKMPPADMFWGDRMAQIADPFGVRWGIATHKQDLSEEEIRKGSEEFARQMAQGGGAQGAAPSGNGTGSTEAPAA